MAGARHGSKAKTRARSRRAARRAVNRSNLIGQAAELGTLSGEFKARRRFRVRNPADTEDETIGA